MDLDASKKAQLIVFMCQLLHMKQPSFPVGFVAHMTMQGVPGTYIYNHNGWYRIV